MTAYLSFFLIHTDIHPLSLSLPSFLLGKLDQGESPAQAAIREVKEEVGFDISDWFGQKGKAKLEQIRKGRYKPQIQNGQKGNSEENGQKVDKEYSNDEISSFCPYKIPVNWQSKTATFYLIEGIPFHYKFTTTTKREISEICWVDIKFLLQSIIKEKSILFALQIW
jgi:8-oxo-dGTP pyrophosphatase MutT (NUDIX family)